MPRYIVARVADVPNGTACAVQAGGRRLALFHADGGYFALADRCPHEGGSLAAGRLVGHLTSPAPGRYCLAPGRPMVQCSWHGWEFDLATGQSWCDPRRLKVRRFKVAVEPGSGLAKGPYVAETFPVSVEDTYLTVEV